MNSAPPTSDDALLGGRVILRQPRAGYRAAIDPILLAASVPARGGEHVLDLGCGAGAAALALLARVPEAHVTGIEIEPEIARLARHNAAANGMAERFEVILGDVGEIKLNARFDHVMANPPFHAAGRHTVPSDKAKARAHVAPGDELARWIAAGLRSLRAGGSFSVIHTPAALPTILAALEGRAGRIVILPVETRPGASATRIIVEAVKGRKTPLALLPAFRVHEAEGGFSPEAEAVLREAAALRLVPQPA